ncbi:MAG TPA: DUF433 domain-containing protein [Longimicrobium sp.]|nr:DUF433 domain-containing protein [Longimicrobium sp.]
MGGREIVRDGETGEAVVSGTTLSVRRALEWLADGGTVEALLSRHPGVAPADLSEALRFAARAVEREGAGGRSVVVDAGAYEAMRHQLAFLQGVCGGLADAAAGRVSLDALSGRGER